MIEQGKKPVPYEPKFQYPWMDATQLATEFPGALNLVGNRIGIFRVLERLTDREVNGRKWDDWKCSCCRCGNVVTISGTNLRRTTTPQQSCGCNLKKGHKHYRQPGPKFGWLMAATSPK